MPLKPELVAWNGDVCIRFGKAKVLVGLSIGNQRVFVHGFLAGSVFAVSKMGGARDETIFFDFQGPGSAGSAPGAPTSRRHLGTPTSLGAPTSPSAPGDADVSSASEGGKCETTFWLFRCVSIRHADGDVGIPQMPTRRRRSQVCRRDVGVPRRVPTRRRRSQVPTRRRRSQGCRRDVGVPRGADETSAFPGGADETSAFPGKSADSSAI